MELLSSAVAEIEVSYKPAKGEQPLIQSSEEANIWFRKFFSSKTISLQEQIMVLYLNRSGRAIGCYKLSVGGITAAIADVRLIFSVGLKLLATSFIIAHNHPSGNSRPSNADIALTQKMNDAGKLMDIKLQDHLILVSEENEYFSFSDDGHI